MELYDFVRLSSASGELHGLRSTSNYARMAIHSHGTWGNFYENRFALGLCRTYLDNGWSYASVNNSGHDFGSLHEDFDSSLPELRGWASQLCPLGEALIMQGHSSGALKILQLLRDPAYSDLKKHIAAVVLISPFDLVAFNGGVGTERAARRQRALELKVEFGGQSQVSTDMFGYWPLSVDTYLQATDAGGHWDLVPTRDADAGALRSTGVPTFVAIGSEDFASYPSGTAVAELIAKQVPTATVTLIEGAPHNFAGYETALADKVDSFLKSLSVA